MFKNDAKYKMILRTRRLILNKRQKTVLTMFEEDESSNNSCCEQSTHSVHIKAKSIH